jgi:hypothetical protein
MYRKVIYSLILFFVSVKSMSNDLTDIIQYGAGYYSSIYIHELGHAAAAKAFGASDITIELPIKGSLFSGATYYNVDNSINLSKSNERLMSLSGLIAGNLANEIVIETNGLHSNPFSQSIAASAHIVNFSNVFNYYTRIRGENGWGGNDIDSYELNGGNPHILSAILISYTLWSLKRMSDKNIPLFGVEYKF